MIAAAIKKIGMPDLVLCGRQASDTDGGQVLHWIAEALDLPTVVPVTKIEAVAGNELTVHRLIEDGYQRLKVQLPALLGVSSEINEARHPSVRGTMAAGRAMIAGWTDRYQSFDLPITFGKIPLLFQNGVWLEDAFTGLAFSIPARNSPLFDIAPFSVNGIPSADGKQVKLWAQGAAGQLAMDAEATLAV